MPQCNAVKRCRLADETANARRNAGQMRGQVSRYLDRDMERSHNNICCARAVGCALHHPQSLERENGSRQCRHPPAKIDEVRASCTYLHGQKGVCYSSFLQMTDDQHFVCHRQIFDGFIPRMMGGLHSLTRCTRREGTHV
jgi:hypothetical protein